MRAIAWKGRAAPEPDGLWSTVDGVLSCEHGDVTTLLSLAAGRYYTLEEPANRIWRDLQSGLSARNIAKSITDDYGVEDGSDVLSDVLALLADLERKRLIEPRSKASAGSRSDVSRAQPKQGGRRRRRRPGGQRSSVAFAMLRLAIVHATLRFAGLKTALRLMPVSPGADDLPLSREWLVGASRTVLIAATLYPLKAQCLERSLCLLWLIRRAGGRGELRFGVHTYPFEAHAWVEYQGRPVNEGAEYLRLYHPLPEIPSESL